MKKVKKITGKNKNRQPKQNDWRTNKDFYALIHKEFKFTFDPCPFRHSIKKWDGTKISWKARNYINPGYDKKTKPEFIKKAVEEAAKGKLCVMLIPVCTSTDSFHDDIWPNAKEIRLIKRRINHEGKNMKGKKVTKSVGQHDSMLVIFKGKAKKNNKPKFTTMEWKGDLQNDKRKRRTGTNTGTKKVNRKTKSSTAGRTTRRNKRK
jgi:hypothetical protein